MKKPSASPGETLFPFSSTRCTHSPAPTARALELMIIGVAREKGKLDTVTVD